ncbi:terminal uridylyltransferase [Chaetoceros tenuissimus]|uniref:Terminal uridylyltransferase n=1 Tax=Chaetoceros tenuissimus TaxID=426638 RepID=A0AAD3D200_9STRA|nr:terminal uridylyltransferase [Chaetoceros tenuissimus]
MNELPRHLVTDLELNSEGWLISKHEKEQKENESINNSVPPVLHACTKLLALIYSRDSKNKNNDKEDYDKNHKDINSTSTEKENDITNLKHVPNIVDQISAVFHQIHKMTCIQPQEETLKQVSDDEEELQQSNSQDSWNVVGKQDSSNLEMEPVYYKEPSERMHLTFNTLQVILPILQPAMTHKDHDNYDLKMKNGPNIRKVTRKADAEKKKQKRVRKSTVYLLFEEQGVYSTSTTKQFNSLSIEYQEIVTYMYRFYRKNKGMPHHYDVNSTSMDHFISSKMLQELFPTSIPSPSEIIANTLIATVDPTMMKFADEMDEKIIHPLALDRYDMHRHHRNSIVILKNRLQQLISNVFKGAVLEVYGSCLSELSLGKSSDVDLSLYIPQMWYYQQQYQSGEIDKAKYQQHVKKTVFRLAGIFRSRSHEGNTSKVEFTKCEAIPYARVPVVKGNYLHANNPFSNDGSLHFDICILNDIAVRNSGLLKAYSTMDLRVKMLMLSIKSWIKHHDIGSAADNTLSSYTWMVMTIFYLQCIGFVPNLQCPVFMAKHGLKYDPNDRMHTVNGLKTVYLTSEQVHKRGIWEQPEEFRATPVSCLLAGFFHFYARNFPHETTAISIRLGNLSLQKTQFPWMKMVLNVSWMLCAMQRIEWNSFL